MIEQVTNIENIYDSKILIVDDNKMNLEILAHFLKGAGFSNLISAINGKQAIEMLEEHNPDLLILDLIMPVMGGMEVIEKIRSRASDFKDIPIIVQTAITDSSQQVNAWKAGASDVISKPVNRTELLTRVQNLLQNKAMIKGLFEFRKSTSEDMRQAYSLQKALLPVPEVLNSYAVSLGLSIKSFFVPARFLSGDLWGIVNLDEPYKVAVWICDFAGKGIRAALQTFRLHALLYQIENKTLQNPKEVLSSLNESLCALQSPNNFATFLFGIVDFSSLKFTYSAAGSPNPIIYNALNNDYLICESSGLPLGISKNYQYQNLTQDIQADSSIILYSDEMWEDDSLASDSFAQQNLDNIFSNLKGKSIVENYSKKFSGKTFSDDLTLIEICKKK